LLNLYTFSDWPVKVIQSHVPYVGHTGSKRLTSAFLPNTQPQL
jgi:hypothetical protein